MRTSIFLSAILIVSAINKNWQLSDITIAIGVVFMVMDITEFVNKLSK